jgi:hypothetical protein
MVLEWRECETCMFPQEFDSYLWFLHEIIVHFEGHAVKKQAPATTNNVNRFAIFDRPHCP